MWRNYLRVGMRALLKSRAYAFINIAGLSIGLAACLLLLLYVRYEMAYDRWLPDHDRVYQVQTIYSDPETGTVSRSQGAHGVITETMPKEFPEIEAISRTDTARTVVLRGNEPLFVEIARVEPNFFDILKLPFLRGDPRTALSRADALVLSRTQATRLFGTVDVVGRTITRVVRGEKSEMRVGGVFEDLPRESHMMFAAFGRIAETDKAACGWDCVNGSVYLKLRPGASAGSINARMQDWERRNIPTSTIGSATVNEGRNYDWQLVPVADVHLSEADGELERPGNDRTTLVTFAVVAALILGMAVINFVNLATARASQRAREVALRKVMGASRRQLIVQFLGESMLLTAAAMVLGLALVELLLPSLSSFLRVDLTIAYWGWDGILLPLVGLLLVVGIAGGLYPAFYLSRFQPALVLRANRSAAEPHGTGRLRSVLVVAQFAISIGLMICTAVVYAQTEFARTTDAGFRREGLIRVDNLSRAQLIPQVEALMGEVARVPGVESVAAGSIYPASSQTLNTRVEVPGRARPITIGFYSTSPEFLATMGTRMLAGRALSRANPADDAFIPYQPAAAVAPAQAALVARGINIVVNRLAAAQFGFSDPARAIGRQVRIEMFDDTGLVPATIVGVVENSRFRSLREQVEPAMFYDRGIYNVMMVRYSADRPETVRQAIGAVWTRFTPEVPFEGEFTDASLAELYLADEARARAFLGFSGLAIVIACLGLFGLAAFTAERRTREIGIRKVFGARVRDIVRLLAWQFSKPVVIANLIAWPAAWWVMRDWLNDFDARIALGPGPFVLAGLIALAIAIGTIAGHALKVARLNPIHALRYE